MNKQIPVPHPRSFDTARGRRAGRIAGALLAMVLAAAPAFAGSSPTGAASAWTDASREQAMERLHAVDQALHERIRVFHATPAGAAAQAALEASTFAAASEIDPSIPFKIARLEALQGDLAAREAQWRALAPTLEPLSEQLREVDRRVEALESVQAAQAREDAALAALRGSLTSMGAYLPGEAADWTHEDLLPPVGVDLRLSHGQTYSGRDADADGGGAAGPKRPQRAGPRGA